MKNKEELEKFTSLYPKLRKNTINIKHIAIRTVDQENNRVVIAVNDKDINKLTMALSDYSVQSFTQVKYTLEDYFMQFYKEDKKFGGAF